MRLVVLVAVSVCGTNMSYSGDLCDRWWERVADVPFVNPLVNVTILETSTANRLSAGVSLVASREAEVRAQVSGRIELLSRSRNAVSSRADHCIVPESVVELTLGEQQVLACKLPPPNVHTEEQQAPPEGAIERDAGPHPPLEVLIVAVRCRGDDVWEDLSSHGHPYLEVPPMNFVRLLTYQNL